MAHQEKQAIIRYLSALVICALVSAACLPLLNFLNLANIIMLYLLAVVLIAVYLGRGPSVLAAFCSVAFFDFLFVPPRFSFTVHDGQYLLTFIVMLLVALVISHLATRLQAQLEDSRNREQKIRALYDYARQLAGAMTQDQVLEGLHLCLRNSFSKRAAGENSAKLLLPDEQEHLSVQELMIADQRIASMVYQTGEQHEGECNIDKYTITLYLPLHGSTRMRGVLAITFPQSESHLFLEQKEFFLAIASLTVTAIERLHFVDVANSAEMAMLSERLRSSILSALSHDIRTPLTVLCGFTDTLKITHPDLPVSAIDILDSIRAQVFRLHNMVENLLDMARLQSGKISLRKEWQPVEEVIGSSINHLTTTLVKNPVTVIADKNFPLLNIDSVLMERVFCNVLENACKYSPENSGITITATVDSEFADICIYNQGSSFPAENAESLLDMFERGRQKSTTPGFGIGLAICRSIVEAHGGRLRVFNPAEGGACVGFTLPLGKPPQIIPEKTVPEKNAGTVE